MANEFEDYIRDKKAEKAAEIVAVENAARAASQKAKNGIFKFEDVVRPVLAAASEALRRDGIQFAGSSSQPTSLVAFALQYASAGARKPAKTGLYRLGFDDKGDPVATRTIDNPYIKEEDLRSKVGITNDLTAEQAAAVIKIAIDEWFNLMAEPR